MPQTFTDKNYGLKELRKQIAELKNLTIKVGVQSDAGFNENNESIVEYATYNEFGTINSGGNIPERSFIRSTADVTQNWSQSMEQAFDSIITGKDDVITACSKVGVQARDDIKRTITDLKTPPNAESTIRKKKSSNPLIDTGALRNSINYIIEKDAV